MEFADITIDETEKLKQELSKLKYEYGRLQVRSGERHEDAHKMRSFLELLQRKGRREKIHWLSFEIQEFLQDLDGNE